MDLMSVGRRIVFWLAIRSSWQNSFFSCARATVTLFLARFRIAKRRGENRSARRESADTKNTVSTVPIPSTRISLNVDRRIMRVYQFVRKTFLCYKGEGGVIDLEIEGESGPKSGGANIAFTFARRTPLTVRTRPAHCDPTRTLYVCLSVCLCAPR